MKKIFLCSLFIFSQIAIFAQTIQGIVQEQNEKGEKLPLTGANVFWLGTQKGTTTDEKGQFRIEKTSESQQLIIQFVGMVSDTIEIKENVFVEIVLQSQALTEIVVKDNKIDVEPIKSELITTKTLKKAACCNLSESFETNASVDVSTTDAVSGTKQIRMLGLDGVYAQIMTENVPFVRGLTARSGLYFIPGTWVKSIDINKGAGSVVNGYESLTGQINIELAKPESSEKLLWNMYVNQAGRIEANLNTSHQVAEKWHTGFLLHASNQSFAVDRNNDTFLDTPEYTQLNFINRWKYSSEFVEAQFGIKALYDDKIAGQSSFKRNQVRNETNPYGFNSKTKRIEGFGKIGFLSKTNEHQSLGIILNLMHHDQSSFWGLTDYQASQTYGLINVIFQTELAEGHGLKTGVSLLTDQYKENYKSMHKDHETGEMHLYDLRKGRNEFVPGIFGEYSFVPNAKFALIAGLRSDFHNLYGNFLTPRLHLKYNLSPKTIARLSAGRGFRVANPIVENMSYLISNRELDLNKLNPEIAWNYGGSITQEFRIGERKASLTADFYRTDFENQIITDLDSDEHSISFYNLNGKSYANSFQISLEYEIIKNLDLTTAYKYYEVRANIGNQMRDIPFVPKDRFFINLGYATRGDKWLFDWTMEWFGKQRIPKNAQNAMEMQAENYASSYLLVNAQITRNFKKWEVYIGAENLGNFMQHQPIIDAQNPFSENFDAGMVYAPVMGRNLYAGFRFTIK